MLIENARYEKIMRVLQLWHQKKHLLNSVFQELFEVYNS